MHNLLQIAQVLKSNGTDGELVMSFRECGPEEIDQNEPVFIYFDGLPVPFFIESLVRRGNKKALVHLTGICSLEDAEEIAGKAVYSEAVDGNDALADGLGALEGWLLLTPANDGLTDESCEADIEDDDDTEDAPEYDDALLDVEEIGEITGYLDIPENPCLEVDTKKGTVIIPFHEDLIISFDPENREIIMDLPEGLV